MTPNNAERVLPFGYVVVVSPLPPDLVYEVEPSIYATLVGAMAAAGDAANLRVYALVHPERIDGSGAA